MRKRNLRLIATSAALAVAVLGMGACSNNDSPSTKPSTGQTGEAAEAAVLTLGSTVVPQSWDPAQVGDANYKPYAQAAYDSLLRREPGGEYVPMLATAWELSDDNKTLSLTLRDDVTFSDGAPFNAEAVKANFEHFAQANGPLAVQLAGFESAEATDDTHVTVTFAEAIPDIVYNLSDAAGRMASPAALGDSKLETVPVGSGPYVMDESATVQGSTYTLTARDDYWAKDLQKYGQVVFKIFADETALVNALKSGQVDAGNLSAADNVASVQADGMAVLHPEYHVSWWGLIMFDRSGALVPELADVRVRQAMACAIDRAALGSAVLGIDDGALDTQVFSEASPAYLPELTDYYSYDLDKAKSLMAQAGVTGFTLPMPSVTGLMIPAVTTGMSQQFAEIGITVEYTEVPITSYLDELMQGKWAVGYMVLGAVPTDWSVVQNYITSSSPWNPLKDSAPELQGYIDAIPGQSDSERTASYQAINRFMVENAWFEPWFWAEENYAVNEDVVQVELQLEQNIPSIYNYSPVS
ncbi:MAG: ABC transporter substrate-binding protein [Bifidobacteriaceae bacterium]|jgi:peptide/nickel transport system substrate-binding protein|nr:ABC transporter substrate-binding protein [Bifidobacteriaceae bacterium]